MERLEFQQIVNYYRANKDTCIIDFDILRYYHLLQKYAIEIDKDVKYYFYLSSKFSQPKQANMACSFSVYDDMEIHFQITRIGEKNEIRIMVKNIRGNNLSDMFTEFFEGDLTIETVKKCLFLVKNRYYIGLDVGVVGEDYSYIVVGDYFKPTSSICLSDNNFVYMHYIKE